MWVGILNKTKQGKNFREFRGEQMNAEVEYDNKIESNKTRDRVAGVL